MVLAPSVAGLFKWRQFEPEMIYSQWAGTCVFHCRTVTSRNSLLSVDFWSTTSPSGGGDSVTPRNLSADCDHSSDRPTTVGEWTKPTSGLRASGRIYTGLSTPAVRRSDFLLLAKRDAAAAERFLAKALGGENHPGPLGVDEATV